MRPWSGPAHTDILQVHNLQAGQIHKLWLHVLESAFGTPDPLPVLVARGRREGPTLLVTAAVHGDELNGIPVIHHLFHHLDPDRLRGTVIGVPVVNTSGFSQRLRRLEAGMDLNTSFPGRPDGDTVDVLAWRLGEQLLEPADALIDLHTASRGRVNSLYVRADMSEPRTARMAYLQRPEIIVHKPPADGTLRGRAAQLGLPAITVEIGDPQLFQRRWTRRVAVGLRAVLADLKMLPRRPIAMGSPPVLCSRSYWVYTDRGGLLTVEPSLGARVKEGDLLGRLTDIFGEPLTTWNAWEEGVVVGHAVDPVARTGARIVHLGIVAQAGDPVLRRRDVLGDVQRQHGGAG